MKKIVVSAICVVMCCIFLCQYAAAEVMRTSFDVSGITLFQIEVVNPSDGSLNLMVYPNVAGVYDGTSYFFDNITHLGKVSMDTYDFMGDFEIHGQWSTAVENVSSYLWFNVYIDYSSNFTLRSDEFYYDKISVSLPDGTLCDNYFLSNTGDYSYLLSFIIDLDDLDYDFANMSFFQVRLPIDCNTEVDLDGNGVLDYVIDCTLALSGITLTYDVPAMSEDLTLVLNSLDNVEAMLGTVIDNQNTTIDEVIATREVLEQLPAELAEALRDIEVGDPYDKSLDTSDIAAYESAYDKVMDEVDVDQVVSIMDGGISLNQDGMYNDQSFDSVSGLMTNIIEATGLMPLIILTLTFGLACFIIGRSGKL